MAAWLTIVGMLRNYVVALAALLAACGGTVSSSESSDGVGGATGIGGATKAPGRGGSVPVGGSVERGGVTPIWAGGRSGRGGESVGGSDVGGSLSVGGAPNAGGRMSGVGGAGGSLLVDAGKGGTARVVDAAADVGDADRDSALKSDAPTVSYWDAATPADPKCPPSPTGECVGPTDGHRICPSSDRTMLCECASKSGEAQDDHWLWVCNRYTLCPKAFTGATCYGWQSSPKCYEYLTNKTCTCLATSGSLADAGLGYLECN